MPIFNRLSKSVHKPRTTGVLAVRYEVPDGRKRRKKRADASPRKSRGSGGGEEDRFQNYLSSSFPGGKARRQVPRIERNQMLLLAFVISMAIFALLYRLVLR